MNQVTTKNPLGYLPVGKLLLSFSIPAIIACLINSVYNIVDQIFIGQGVGYLGNAATTVAFPIVTIIMAFSTLLGSGSSAYAAIKLGEQHKTTADKTLNNLMILSLITGLAAAALGLLFLEPLLRLFGATDTIMPYAKDYTSIILMGAPFSVISVGLSSMARTDGNPHLSMYGILIGAVLNTILDPLYIFVFHWGVKGAAIATVTSQVISCVVLLVYFLRPSKTHVDHMRLEKKYLTAPDLSIMKNILTLGISSGISSGVACLMQVVMNNSLVYYGDLSPVTGEVALSAMGIVMKIAMILASIAIGIGIGCQPILGFNMGAKHFHRVRRTYTMAAIFATLSIAVFWVLCQLFPNAVINLFGSGSPEFNTFAVQCLKINLFGIFCAGFQMVSTNYFQATGQPLKASVLSMLRQLLLLIPLLLILPRFFGLGGVLFATPVADIGSAIIVALMIIPEMKKLNARVHQEDANQ